MAICPEDAEIVHDLVWQALVSAQEVMGENGLNAVLRDSGLERFIGNFPPNDTNPGSRRVSTPVSTRPSNPFTGAVGKACCGASAQASYQ